MKTAKRFAAIASGLALAAAGFVSPLSAEAAVTVKAPQYTQVGNDISVTVSGCTAGDNAYAALIALDDTIVDTAQGVADANGSASLSLVAGDVSARYDIISGCGKYDAASAEWDSAAIFVFASTINFTPDQWKVGQAVTISSEGFLPGEKVTATIYSSTDSTKVLWTKELGTAKADGTFSASVVLPELAKGEYALVLSGASGSRALGAFYWGSQDTKASTSSTSKTVKVTVPTKTTIGLPKAGV